MYVYMRSEETRGIKWDRLEQSRKRELRISPRITQPQAGSGLWLTLVPDRSGKYMNGNFSILSSKVECLVGEKRACAEGVCDREPIVGVRQDVGAEAVDLQDDAELEVGHSSAQEGRKKCCWHTALA